MLIPFSGVVADSGLQSIDLERSNSDTVETSDNLPGIGTGDFTVEAWIKPESLPAKVALFGVDSVDFGCVLSVEADGDVTIEIVGGSTTSTATGLVTTGTWQHVALSRSGTNARVFVDGVNVWSTITAGSIVSGRAILGQANQAGSGSDGSMFDGLMYRARWSNTARYTTAFTPSKTYTTDANTLAMIVGMNGAIIDTEGSTILTTGSPTTSTDIPT